MNEYPKLFTSTADFIRHATLSYTDTAFGNASEDDSSENEADIEFIASQVAGETFHELNTWLGQQINWSWQNRKNAEANAFELVFDKVQRFLKGER